MIEKLEINDKLFYPTLEGVYELRDWELDIDRTKVEKLFYYQNQKLNELIEAHNKLEALVAEMVKKQEEMAKFYGAEL